MTTAITDQSAFVYDHLGFKFRVDMADKDFKYIQLAFTPPSEVLNG